MQHSIRPTLFALTGKAGSGKDTLADYLVQSRGFVKLSLAAPIKRGIEAMFGLGPEVWDRDKKEVPLPGLGVSPRRLAQTLGTEWGRQQIADDLWINVAIAAAQSAIRAGHAGVVIADVRFDNEAEALGNVGFNVVKIERPGVAAVEAHVSEKGVDPWFIDKTLQNDGSPADLFARFDSLYPEP